MKKILINYNFRPNKDFLGENYLIYDRSDSKDWLKDLDQSKIIYKENIGQVDFDKLTYLHENYDHLPDVFLWGKTNLFKYIEPEEYEKVKDNKVFTPLLTQNHRTYQDELGMVNYYQNGMYYERNNSWYVSPYNSKYCATYQEFAHIFGLPIETFIPFAPGGNHILTKEVVHKYPKELYKRMADLLSYHREPAEAYMAERSYYNLWR